MSIKMSIALRLAAVAVSLFASELAQANSDECAPVRDAIARLGAATFVQQHGIVTRNGARPVASDLLAFGDLEYWREGTEDWEVRTRQQIPLVLDSLDTVFECERTGSEILGSAVATSFAYKRLMPVPRGVRNVRMWISDNTGLPIRSYVEIDPEGTKGTAEYTFSYNSDAVQPSVARPPIRPGRSGDPDLLQGRQLGRADRPTDH